MFPIQKCRPSHSTLARLAHSASSSRWLARQRSDPFVRQKADGEDGSFRSRAAFKLLEMQKQFTIIRPRDAVVDLGCAPGSWLQVSSNLISVSGGAGILMGVDLLRMDPVDGAHVILGDFLQQQTQSELLRHMAQPTEDPKDPPQMRFIDVVLSDMAPNISGNRTADVANSLRLSEAAITFAMRHLKIATTTPSGGKQRGGNLVMKYFAHPELTEFRNTYLTPHFKSVHDFKPKSSRKESSETYWVCKDLHLP